jgi:RNA-directed DNA polymerase
MLEKAKKVTSDRYTHVEYARYADDLVVVVDAYPRHDWLLKGVNQRLREEFAKIQVEVNEEKSRVVDLAKGESFGFLGFEIRRVRSSRGVWRPQAVPQTTKRTVLLRKLREKFRRWESQPVERVIGEINPILRGWVNYFAIGNSARCFNYIRDWVEKKVRRHLMRARKRKGFGWKRWSKRWIYEELGLFNEYRVRYMKTPQAVLSVR